MSVASGFAVAANNALHAGYDGGLEIHLARLATDVNLRHHLVGSHNQDGEFAGSVGGMALDYCHARHVALHTAKGWAYNLAGYRIHSNVPLLVKGKYSDEQPRYNSFKHYPGGQDHDQSTHGRGSMVGGIDQFIGQTDRKAESYLGPHGAARARKLKAGVCKALGDRIAKTEDPQEVYKNLYDIKAWKDSGKTNWRGETVYGPAGKPPQAIRNLNSDYFDAVLKPAAFAKLPATTQQTVIKEAMTNYSDRAVGGWAQTAGDHDDGALLMQAAAAKEFGLGGARGALPKQLDVNTPQGRLSRMVVRNMYDETQADLKRAGIKSVQLWRGLDASDQELPRGVRDAFDHDERARPSEVRLRPMSSFSSDGDQASEFGATVLSVKVPAARILSTPKTGFGCLDEREFVVLGQSGVRVNWMDADAHSERFDQLKPSAWSATTPGQRKHYPGGQDHDQSTHAHGSFEPGPPIEVKPSPEMVAHWSAPTSQGMWSGGVPYRNWYDKVDPGPDFAQVKKDNIRDITNEVLKNESSETVRSTFEDKRPTSLIPAPGKPQSSPEQQDEYFTRRSVENAVDDAQRGWANTAADTDPEALTMQRAVAREFGLKDAEADLDDSVRRSYSDSGGRSEYLEAAIETSQKYADGPLGRMDQTIVRNMYENTQKQLAKDGVKDVTVYRGMQLDWEKVPDAVKANPGSPAGAIAPVAMRPASSFTTSRDQAMHFTGGYSTPSKAAIMLSMKVPASRILSTARTGLGCLEEEEVVVLGTPNAQARWVVGKIPSTGEVPWPSNVIPKTIFCETHGVRVKSTAPVNIIWHKYNEDEPRDDAGRWTSGGGYEPGLLTAKQDPLVKEHFKGDFAGGEAGDKQVKSAIRDAVTARIMASEDPATLARLTGITDEMNNAASMREQAVGYEVRSRLGVWSETSADSDENAVRMQLSAAREFGLPSTVLESFYADKRTGGPAFLESCKQEAAGPKGELDRMILHHMYANTQDQLAQAGIKEMTVFRGMNADEESLPPALRGGGDKFLAAKVNLQPMSSFSASKTTAKSFQAGPGAYTMLAVKVPANRILSTAMTGLGCRKEQEVCLLGTTDAKATWSVWGGGD